MPKQCRDRRNEIREMFSGYNSTQDGGNDSKEENNREIFIVT